MKLRLLACAALSLALVAGCGGKGGLTSLTIGPRTPVHDQSVPTPTKAAYQTVMVLPPRGSERGAVTDLAALERALLKHGVRVISSGVTGRVVDGPDGRRVAESATQLNDLERALVLARKSNADAVLQLMDMGWRDDVPELYRYYWFDEGAWQEMTTKPDGEWYRQNRGKESRLVVVKGPALGFTAKVIDVESGEIVASVELIQSTVGEVEGKTVYFPKKGKKEIKLTSDELRRAVIDSVMNRLADVIVKGQPRGHGPKATSPAGGEEPKKK
jgi:hypothetical protein